MGSRIAHSVAQGAVFIAIADAVAIQRTAAAGFTWAFGRPNACGNRVGVSD